MFQKVLIANRSEIACRVIETCRKMGVKTVAVYSEPDKNARHVEMADEAIALGGVRAVDSYLKGDAIIAAARETGAEAIHPGYGFLSENPDFAEAVEAAGLTFIGPSADTIRRMGLKDTAKSVMEAAGVPVVPGYHGVEQSNLDKHAGQIGFPVMIKAVAGGGGKGMRIVETAKDFEEALASAKSEALASFGNDDVLLEKYISSPRHIEFQIFGDGEKAIHLYERDCSLQRRHQKVLEEAPAPGMTESVRKAMGDAAVKAAEACSYKGAGTVEFIADASDGLREDRFWFMEMNTRLQVEHPVTEAITGVDLVEWQLRVAFGEQLPQSQEDLSITGNSVELRLYAEDVPAGFLPATGILKHLTFGKTARVDSGVLQGDEISPYYDPMIAKLTVHGTDRPKAFLKAKTALEETKIAGTTTNLAFLSALAEDEDVLSGRVETGLIAHKLETLSKLPRACSRSAALAAFVSQKIPSNSHIGFSLWSGLAQSVTLVHLGESLEFEMNWSAANKCSIKSADTVHVVERNAEGFLLDGQPVSADAFVDEDEVVVFWNNAYQFEIPDPFASSSDSAKQGDVLAPMPGQVKAVLVTEGETVQEGQTLVVLEAMKMEHRLTASVAGKLAVLAVSPGDQVQQGDLIAGLSNDNQEE